MGFVVLLVTTFAFLRFIIVAALHIKLPKTGFERGLAQRTCSFSSL